MAQQYRKKPVVIEAVRLGEGNVEAVAEWCKTWKTPTGVGLGYGPDGLSITTLEGTMHADIGDWVIKGVKGEFYPCKNDIFEATYEEV